MTGEEVLEWVDRNGFILGEWQREMIRRYWGSELLLPPRPEPRKPVQTRRVQRRRQSRAERKRYLVIIDELS